MVSEKELYAHLKQEFGFTRFKAGQKQVIQRLLAGGSTVAILPTGTGKSLCYQFVGTYTNQTVLIISPLLSLMQDQVEQLRLKGEKRVVALNSNLSYAAKKQILANLHQYLFIYLAPEMLNNPVVLAALTDIDLGLLVVDEAHCISAWGPDFRPDYLQLGKLRQKLGFPVTLALTATATKRVTSDMMRSLKLGRKVKVIRNSVDRPNIFLAVEKSADTQEKNQRLIQLIRSLPAPGLIYFSSKKQCDQICALLNAKSKLTVASYHAGLPAGDRYAVQQQFLGGQIDLICATSAFGMGINKPDIRYVIHYHLPENLESYLQEIGRAGRDGQQSLALILYSEQDRGLQQHLALSALPTNAELEILQNSPQLLEKSSQENQSAQLVWRYMQMGVSFPQMSAVFSQRRTEKLQALQQILAYVNTQGCRRKFILRYFDETKTPQHFRKCCQLANESFDYQQLFDLAKTKNEPNIFAGGNDYEQILKNLFKTD
ncbi:ATP-dependent DNA helicase RecQ [Ligilactobacillus salitolerans]|uniref:ATP-dependent DNA helicase RecQ n=1 Tax=Ligilactobacillus salitolerans TaxID=1808352 RepID=A0A401ITM9_9LACO|nr:RecQ family ATP-dependent DNA helicase [Ligilactobacillus salitolerans]GBG94857.1 ATP-dependent DNA helicase RecQ [Ligilactobacillus salitolerans]